MARRSEDLNRLIRELAALSPEERAQVIARASEQSPRINPLPLDFEPPKVSIGGAWSGGDLRREDLYDDDGR